MPKERYKRSVDMDKISLKVQWINGKFDDPSEVNMQFRNMRKALKCSFWRLHFLKRIPEDHKLISSCKEKTVQHHKVSVKRFEKLEKYYCQKCQAIYYKE